MIPGSDYPTRFHARQHDRQARRWTKSFLLLAAALAAFWYLPRAGLALVAEDAFDHADLGIVLSGSPVERTLAARDLYRAHRIDRILIIPEPTDRGWRELVALKLEDPEHPLSERILTASGVPVADIAFLPQPQNGTLQEAKAVQDFLSGRVPDRMILITAKTASRRARMIFRHVFRLSGTDIRAFPTPYDSFDAHEWWRQPRQALVVLTEHEKFLVNAVTLAIERLAVHR